MKVVDIKFPTHFVIKLSIIMTHKNVDKVLSEAAAESLPPQNRDSSWPLGARSRILHVLASNSDTVYLDMCLFHELSCNVMKDEFYFI